MLMTFPWFTNPPHTNLLNSHHFISMGPHIQDHRAVTDAKYCSLTASFPLTINLRDMRRLLKLGTRPLGLLPQAELVLRE